MKQLQLKYDGLQQRLETPTTFDITSQYKQLYTENASKSIVERHSCTCKGKCSSRTCGCVKKMITCNYLCKCSDKLCQNQVTFFI